MNINDLTVYPKQFTDQIAKTLAGSTRIINGLTLSATGAGSLSVTVAAGTLWVNGTFVSYAGGTVTPGAAGVLPRYDCIRIASGAAVPSVVAGTAASTPALPALGANDLFLGFVFIGAGATDYTSSTTAFINDYTFPLTLGDGTAARPSLPFANSLQTGPYLYGTGGYGIATEGVGRTAVTSTGDLVPVSTSVQDLGTSTLKWNEVNAVEVRASQVSVGQLVAASLSIGELSAASASVSTLHVIGTASVAELSAASASIGTLHVTGLASFAELSAASASIGTLHVTSLASVAELSAASASIGALHVTGLASVNDLIVTNWPKCRVFNSTALTVASTASVCLTFDSERYDNSSMHAPGSARIVLVTSGTYLLGANMAWDLVNRSGFYIQMNDVASLNIAAERGITNDSARKSITGLWYASVSGDYAEVIFANDTASAVSVIAGPQYSPEFWAVRVG